MFRTEASKVPTGNWLVQATCTKGHTVYKDQYHLGGNPYRCPYCDGDVY